MRTVSEPITGTEYRGSRSSPKEALSHFYRAFNSHDLAMMEENWETSADAVMANPLGGISRGWDEIRKIYQRLFDGVNRVEVEFWDYAILENEDFFVAVGRERGTVTNNSGVIKLEIRTSRFFRRHSPTGWQQVHHHGSIDDPKLLSDYQRAVTAG